jgi:hypothetical protein
MPKRPPKQINTADIQQREGEDVADCILRLAKMSQRMSQGSGHGKSRGINRKNLVRKLGKLRKGSEPPVNVQDPAFVEHMRKIQERREADFQKGPMRFMGSLFATAEHMRRDPQYKEELQNTPVDRRLAHMVKPWKGRQGREAAKGAATTTKRKDQKRERAIELHRQGHTEIQIAKMIGRTERTVRRYLTGR